MYLLVSITRWQSASKAREATQTSYHTEVSISMGVNKNARVKANLLISSYGWYRPCEMHVLARKEYSSLIQNLLETEFKQPIKSINHSFTVSLGWVLPNFEIPTSEYKEPPPWACTGEKKNAKNTPGVILAQLSSPVVTGESFADFVLFWTMLWAAAAACQLWPRAAEVNRDMSFVRVQRTRVRPAFPHSFSGKTRIVITSSQGYQCSQHSQGSPSLSLKQQLNFMASMNVRSSPFWASLDLILTEMNEPWCFAWFQMKAGDIWQLQQEFWVLLYWELKAKLSGTCKCKAAWKPSEHTKQAFCVHPTEGRLVHFAQSQSTQFSPPYSCGAEPWEDNQCLSLKNLKHYIPLQQFSETQSLHSPGRL